jgi:hypothetical protein
MATAATSFQDFSSMDFHKLKERDNFIRRVDDCLDRSMKDHCLTLFGSFSSSVVIDMPFYNMYYYYYWCSVLPQVHSIYL